MPFERIPGKFAYTGMDLKHPPDRLPPGRCSLLFNLQPDLLSDALSLRPPIVPLANTIAGAPVHSLIRMNDSVPEAAATPFARFAGVGAKLYSGAGAPLALLDSGFSGNPLAQIPYVPPQSPESWLYVYDSLKQQRYKTNGTEQNIGIQSPFAEPSVARIQPLYDTVDNATAAWAVYGAPVGGAISAPAVVARVPASTTIGAILFDSGTTGMACITPANSASSYAWMTSGSMVALDTETVAIEQVFAGSYATTVAAIQYDSGATGSCTIVPAIPLPGLARNMLVYLNSAVYARVSSVTAGPDGSYSFRCNTGAVTIAAGQTIAGLPSFRAWCTLTHAASATITGNSINAAFTPTVSGGSMSGIVAATPGTTNLSYAGARPLQNEDYMHLSIGLDQPDFVTEIHVLLDVDAVTNDFAHNYYYYVLRQGDFQQSAVGGQTTVQDQLASISNTIASQLIAEEYVDQGAPQAPYPIPEQPSTSAPSTEQLQIGQLAWLEAMFKLNDLTRVGNDATRSLANVASIGILVYTSGGVVNLYFGGWWAGGGYGPDCNFNSYGNQAPEIQWRYRYRNSLTGAHSTVSPETRNGEILRRQAVTLSCPNSPDPQVDTVDWERRGGTNPDWHYVGSVPQGNTFLDNVTENAAQAGDPLEVACYQPWPVTDVPRTGTALVVGTSILWQSGDQFNPRWLRGTGIIIGGNTYSLFAPPASATALQLAQCIAPPSGIYPFQIPEATIEGQPLYGAWLDETNNRVLAIGDPLNPGLMYFSNPGNPDGASDSGYLFVTGPSEPLLNGFFAEGSNWVFTSSSLYRVDSTPGAVNPYAAYRVSGVEGLAAPWAFDAQRKLLFWWGPDGFYVYGYGAEATNLTENDLYPLFPHAGQQGEPGIPGVPVSIASQIVYPPNYSNQQWLRANYSENFVYASYLNSVGAYETLVYSLGAKGWRKDNYSPQATLFVLEKGVPNPLLMAGGADGNVYQVSSASPSDAGGNVNYVCLPPAQDAGDSRAVKQWGDMMFSYSGAPSMQVLWDNLLIAGAAPVIAPETNRTNAILDLFTPPDTNDTPLIHFNVAPLISGYGPVFLYEWQPSFAPLPEITTSRVTSWRGVGLGGSLHNAFVQGIRLHANTFGQVKSFEVQYDGYLLGAGPIQINFNGQQTQAISWPVPFRGHMVRLVPLDDVPWEVWDDSEWIAEPEPEEAAYWVTQPTSMGQQGYIHCREMWAAWAGSGLVSVIIDGAAPVTLAVLGAAASPVKQYFPTPPLKGRYWQLTGTGTGLALYERDIEFLVKSWGSTGPYSRVRPFGDQSGGGGASGARV